MIESSDAYREAIVADARRMRVKAVVDIEDPDLVQGDVTSVIQEPGISRPLQVWDKGLSINANYASMETNRWVLDGSYIPRPEDSAARDWQAGLVGALLSREDGMFNRPQWVQISFRNVSVLQAFTVVFSDRPDDGLANRFDVEIFSEGVAYYTKTVINNTESAVSFTGFRVNNPDAIRVTVFEWSLPWRRMRIAEIIPGVYETWKGDEIEKSGLEVKMQGDPSCMTLPYGAASIKMYNENRRFDPRTKDGIFPMIEERQGIQIFMGPELPNGAVDYKPLGTFYQAGRGWKTGDNGATMRWDLVDIVGLLAHRTFLWDEKDPLPTTLQGWLEALAGQLGVNFTHRIRVDPACAELPVSAELKKIKGMTCGDILRYVCMATGTWPRADASTGFLTAEPLWNEGNKITLDNLSKYPTMSANEDVASVTVSGYTAKGNAPACDNVVEVKNPFIAEGKGVDAVRGILAFYGGNRLETIGRGDPSSEIGDVDVVWLAEGNATCARRVKQQLAISEGVLKNCSSTFIRGDGLFLFTNREQILESGTWTVPNDVWRLQVVLVGHGSAGGGGSDGGWSNVQNKGSGGYVYGSINRGAGKRGNDGSGGKIWEGVIDVNPG